MLAPVVQNELSNQPRIAGYLYVICDSKPYEQYYIKYDDTENPYKIVLYKIYPIVIVSSVPILKDYMFLHPKTEFPWCPIVLYFIIYKWRLLSVIMMVAA